MHLNSNAKFILHQEKIVLQTMHQEFLITPTTRPKPDMQKVKFSYLKSCTPMN